MGFYVYGRNLWYDKLIVHHRTLWEGAGDGPWTKGINRLY